MSFEKNFCSSPWFHMRINNTGNYEYCRWAVRDGRLKDQTIKQVSPVIWFQKNMADIRKSMLAGETIPGCSECQEMEKHGKVSGRQRQLLKTGIRTDAFAPTMQSSPWLSTFKSSATGETEQVPQDWQVDLGNFCNSGCLFCNPHSSSKLASEFKQLGMIDIMPARSWGEDPVSLQVFIDAVRNQSEFTFLHFIGGETLITPSFKKILQALIDAGLNNHIVVGFTVNLTVWDQAIVDLLCQFKQVHLGMSIECINPVNDYARYGSKLENVLTIMNQWIQLGHSLEWALTLRITPTILTALYLDTVYYYAKDQGLTVESSNFISDPAFMRPTVLPSEYRLPIIEKLKKFLNTDVDTIEQQVFNIRNPQMLNLQLKQDVESYINYLTNSQDESYRLPELVTYLKRMESSRKNSVLDYLPEYENLFRTAGY